MFIIHNYNCKQRECSTSWTLLHFAAEHGWLRLSKLLVKHGSDIDSIDKYGHSIIQDSQPLVREYLLLCQMGGSMREKILVSSTNIRKQSKIIEIFLKKLMKNALKEAKTTQKEEEEEESKPEEKKDNEKTIGKCVSRALDCLSLLSETIMELLNDKMPISQDLLLIAWKYLSNEMKFNQILNSSGKNTNSNAKLEAYFSNFNFEQNNTNANENRLWKRLGDTCRQSLQHSNICKARNFFYFKEYILPSNIWFQKVIDSVENGNIGSDDESNEKQSNKKSRVSKLNKIFGAHVSSHLLFDELVNIVNEELEPQQAYLQKSIMKAMNEEKEDWNKVIEFKEFTITNDLNTGIRQDSIIDKETGRNIMETDYKHKALICEFNEHDLDIMSGSLANDSNIDVHHHYDLNIYLNRLLIAAHNVNYAFQASVKKMFGKYKFGTKESKTGKINVYNKQIWIEDYQCVYAEAPVKLRERCVVKLS